MNIWNTLGIEETKDRDKLKTAYRERLKSVNPEDDQEGFMKLREAYEEALRLAEKPDDIFIADNEHDERFPFPYNEECLEVLKLTDDIYRDFNERIKEENWNELFNRDEFIAIDRSEDAFNALVNFLMMNFLIPHNIWKIIVETFDVENRKKELCDRFPKDFIEFMLDNAGNIDIINYYLFDYDVDNELVDEFIKTYLTFNSAVRRNQLDDAEKLMEKLEEFDIYHPYLELGKIRLKIQSSDDEKNEENYEKLKKLFEEFPDDFNIASLCGDMALVLGKYDEAENYYNLLKKIEPDSIAIKVKFADLAFYKEDYTASRDAYMELLRDNNYENTVRAGMLRANMALIEKYKNDLEINPEDSDTKTELAWSLYQSYRFEEAVEILNTFAPDNEKRFEYYNVKGRSYLCLLDYDNALSCFFCWKEAIDSIAYDDSEEALKKKKRLPYVNFLIADCLLKKKRFKDADEYLSVALATEHDEMILSYEALCELKYESGKYEECIEACEKLLEFGDKNYIAYDYMSKACFKLNYIKEAVDACENAIHIYPYAADPYVQEFEIFIELEQFDTAKKIIERYRQFEIPSDQIAYCEAVLLKKEGKYEEAVERLEKLENVNINESDLLSFIEVYSELADCYMHLKNYGKEIYCLNKIREMDSKYDFIDIRIAIAYKKMGNLKKAYEYMYSGETKEISDVHLRKPKLFSYYTYEGGNIYREMGRYQSAIHMYQRALKFNMSFVECYRDLAFLYERTGNYYNADKYYKLALEYARSDEQRAYFYLCMARVLQCTKQNEQAKQIYMMYLEKYEICADFIYDYSVLLQNTNDTEKAIELIKDNIGSITDKKEENMILRRLCEIYAEEGYLNNANETFDVLIGKYSNDYKAYKIMADALKQHGLYTEASELYNKAIVLDIGEKENYYSDLAENELLKKHFSNKDIKKIILKALSICEKKRNVIDYIKCAQIYRITKKYKLAIQVLDEYLNNPTRCFGCFGSECHKVYYEKGKVYEAVKDYNRAKVFYQMALKIKGHSVLYEESLKRIEVK